MSNYPTIESDGEWTKEKVEYWYNITELPEGFWYNPLSAENNSRFEKHQPLLRPKNHVQPLQTP